MTKPLLRFGNFIVNVDEVSYFWKRESSLQCYIRNNNIAILIPSDNPIQDFERIHKECTSLVWISDFLVNPFNVAYFWQREGGVQAFLPGGPIPLSGVAKDNRLSTLTS